MLCHHIARHPLISLKQSSAIQLSPVTLLKHFGTSLHYRHCKFGNHRSTVIVGGTSVKVPHHKAKCMSTAMDNSARRQLLQPYQPPDWAAELNVVPKYRIKLANVNTPIQRWYLPGLPEGYEVYIKRDDMLGCELSGNKVRKLEFLLADAVDRGCTSVITCGGIQSNHCRSTALASRQLGLQPYLLLRSVPDPGHATHMGNMLLNRLSGSQIYLIPRKAQQVDEIMPRMQQLAQALKQEKGEDACIMPIGGSTPLGLYGYLEGFNELLQQDAPSRFSDIALATGSGGTTTGLAVGNYLTKSNMRCHGFTVSDSVAYFRKHINDMLKDIGLWEKFGLQSDDIVDLVDGVKGQGYGISTQEELDFITDVSMKTGILLDRTYTGKAALHLVKQLWQNPDRFRGNKILFIHTGGIFSLFDGCMDTVLESPGASRTDVQNWFELTNKVPYLP